MKTIVLLFVLVLVFALLVKMGMVEAEHGCPDNEDECHEHCKSIGKSGGYCVGPHKQTCRCN
uniref:Defensin BmKDfsin1 n=1 Tax=Olivierus martensii TaxID=34649 RepID=DEF1_OLIMR|nr:RecName: Full=Defensin BmKDfsin1; Flags: Precursor [Mesobuthus martensii]